MRDCSELARALFQLAVLTGAASAVAPCLLVHAQSGEVVEAASAVYVRQDTNDTTVITPRIRAGARVLEDTRVDVAYAVDVWTSASVDIVTAATQRVTEQRDELDVNLTQTLGDLTLGGGYRFSTEHDYTSHGATVSGTLNLAQNNTTIDAAASALFDDVGRAGDPNFHHDLTTYTVRLGLTQVIDAATLAQLVYEIGSLSGYLASPYRTVPLLDPMEPTISLTCRLPATNCRNEVNPDSRMRHAIALRGRRALGETLSVGLGYRFYLDDWDVLSHTGEADVAFMPSERWLLSLGYRFYTQSSASHYQKLYYAGADTKYLTTDKELSSIMGHRLELEAARSFEGDGDSAFRLVVLVAPSYYSYPDFLRLDQILALESTLALEWLR